MIYYIKFFFLYSKTSHIYVYLNLRLLYKYINFKNFNFFFNFFKNYIGYSFSQINYYKVFFENISTNSLPQGLVNFSNIKYMHSENKKYVGNKLSFRSFFFNSDLKVNSKSGVSDIFDYLYTYSSVFKNYKDGLPYFYNFSKKLNIQKFNFFILLLGANWHLILNNSSVNGSQRLFIETNISLGGMRQYSVFSITTLWQKWSNLFFLILNISFFNVSFLSFGKTLFKKIIDYFNWLTWGFSFFFWKFFNNFFFFKYSRISKTSSDFFLNFKGWFSGITLILDVNYHYNFLFFSNKYNIFNIALADTNVEPWLSWYPIPCRGSDPVIQYLFLILILKIRLVGINFSNLFRLNYIFLLKLFQIVNTLNNFFFLKRLV